MSTQAAAERTGDAVRTEDIVELARLMAKTPSPPGQERRLAERLAEAGQRMAPDLQWRVDPFDSDRANLLVTAGPADYRAVEVMLFAHLDTSLAGVEEYRHLTGCGTDAETGSGSGLAVRDGKLIGPGMAVAKGPAAGALAALLAGHRAGTMACGTAVLLTSGGTHRAPADGSGFAAGLRHALESGLSPRGAINVKAGAPCVLHEEPGSANLRISVRSPGGPLMLQQSERCAGAAAALARLLPIIENWRNTLRGRDPSALCGRDVGLGALAAGLPDKPDMLPSVSWADLYVVTAPGDDASELADELALLLASDTGSTASVSVTAFMPAGRTPLEHPVVELATRAWNRHLGPAAPITGWLGSTDGALLRHMGIPVARLGPRPRSAPAGLEALDLTELATFARIDAELLVQMGSPEAEQGGRT